jgi:small-conductance mechanosensitive channel
MTYLIAGGAIAFVLFLFRVPGLLASRRITRKAHTDYAACRGTVHARQLRSAIERHEAALRPLFQERNRIGAALDSLARTELKELRQALTRHLVDGPFVEVRGVGPKLKERIVEACFDGTLESLIQAQHVPGVGEEKAVDIRAWVQETQNKMPQLLKGVFDGKAEIQDRYGRRRNDLTSRRIELDQVLATRRALLEKASEKLTVLELVTPALYRAALQGDVHAAERVAAHTLGAFPEWAPEPTWFTAILRAPEEGLT